MGWVYRHSPYTGAVFQVHQAVADSVNDQHANEFWMTKGKLASKARTSVASAKRAMTTLCEGGYLELLEESAGRGPSRYRFLYPETPVVYDARGTGSPRTGSLGPPTGSPRTGQPVHHEPPTGSPGAEMVPYKERSQEDPKGSQTEGRRRRIPEPFVVSAAMARWAAEKWPAVDWRAETEQFVDHHRGKGSVQLDWAATWRTWIRNAGTRFAPRGAVNGHAPMAKVDQQTLAAMQWAERKRAQREGTG